MGRPRDILVEGTKEDEFKQEWKDDAYVEMWINSWSDLMRLTFKFTPTGRRIVSVRSFAS